MCEQKAYLSFGYKQVQPLHEASRWVLAAAITDVLLHKWSDPTSASEVPTSHPLVLLVHTCLHPQRLMRLQGGRLMVVRSQSRQSRQQRIAGATDFPIKSAALSDLSSFSGSLFVSTEASFECVIR